MNAGEGRFHLFGKLLLHLLLEEPLRILDMNRAGTKNMFMKSPMRQKLKELPEEQYELLRDVFIHLATGGISDLLGFLAHEKDGDADDGRRFGDTAETATHCARVTVDGETVDLPPDGRFFDWVGAWQKEAGIHPTRREIAEKYHDHDGKYSPERVSYGDDPPNAPRLAMEKFGRLVIENCKDETVGRFEWLLNDVGASDLSRALSAKIAAIPEETKDALRDCVIESAMNGVHDFLFALQQSQDFGEGIEVTVDGFDIVQASDGLHGEIFGEEGFDAKFSKYPTSDDIEEKYRKEIRAVKRRKGKK